MAQENLAKDKRVLGKEWLSTYGHYFSDEENIQLFVDAVTPHLPDRPLDVLYVASASGLLGEKLMERLGRGTLTLVDISQKHLDENKNPNTIKRCVDLLEMNLGKTFEVIIMRSSLDYFPSRSLQIQALRVIKQHLKPDGLFVNQPAFIPLMKERDDVSRVYNTIEKIGKRWFQSQDLPDIYQEAGFVRPQKIGEGKVMQITEQDHIQRYDLHAEDVHTIQHLLKEKAVFYETTKDGYVLRFEFPIFLSRPQV